MGCDLFQSPAFSLRDKGQREKDAEGAEGSGEPEGTIGSEHLLQREKGICEVAEDRLTAACPDRPVAWESEAHGNVKTALRSAVSRDS